MFQTLDISNFIVRCSLFETPSIPPVSFLIVADVGKVSQGYFLIKYRMIIVGMASVRYC